MDVSDNDLRIYVLGADTGFRSFGLSKVQIYPELKVVAFTTFLVKASKDDPDKKTEVILEVGQTMGKNVGDWIEENFKDTPPTVIAAEGISIPQKGGPSVALKLGVGWGILMTHAARYGIPIFQRFPATLKQHITGKRTTSKKEMQSALESEWGVDFKDMLLTHREHAADSIAAAITVAQTEKMVKATLNAVTSHVS